MSYGDKCKCIIKFGTCLPFIDMDLTQDEVNYFDDYPLSEIDDFFLGRYIPDSMDSSTDEACIFYAEEPDLFYSWYNGLDNKKLPKLVSFYADLIKQI
ncbi:hypothetical protein CHU32_02605 [Superficieibacter electus]|uniref:Uncharacterized protein n=1 Tax=Superficieibacter electus TaxID=2022662 RepID=A0A2P5GUW4_9ENTR|nr:hypothetical protein CHU33_12715 [Superficieibacter electus]POP50333.1 hypothetical protein CHU32_02605 [Superficieibacter electus]